MLQRLRLVSIMYIAINLWCNKELKPKYKAGTSGSAGFFYPRFEIITACRWLLSSIHYLNIRAKRDTF